MIRPNSSYLIPVFSQPDATFDFFLNYELYLRKKIKDVEGLFTHSGFNDKWIDK